MFKKTENLVIGMIIMYISLEGDKALLDVGITIPFFSIFMFLYVLAIFIGEYYEYRHRLNKLNNLKEGNDTS